MRIIADEMISPKIVEIVRKEHLSSEFVFESVHHVNLRETEDEDWIETFSKGGGSVFISGDRAMLKRESLVQGISRLGIIGVYLPAMWANAPGSEQLAYIAHWWDKIESTLFKAERGSIWLVPGSMRGGSLTPWINKNAIKRAKQEANRKV